jgi:heterodisulfide reductase subunit C2
METFKRKLKYEQFFDHGFAQRVSETPWGKDLFDCIQCGACTGICPTSIYMDYAPRRIVAMVREGMKEDVLKSFTIWLCSSCYACTVNCPQKIKITDIMYGLKRMAIEEGHYPRKFPIPLLAKAFFDMAKRNGRTTEFLLASKLMLKTGLGKIFSYLPIGFDLMKTGRMSLKTERVSEEGRKQLQEMLRAKEGSL